MNINKNRDKAHVLSILKDAGHTGATYYELRNYVINVPTDKLPSIIRELIRDGYVKVAGGYMYASEFTQLLQDNDGSIPLVATLKHDTLADNIEAIASATGYEREQRLDKLMRMMFNEGISEEEIVISLARVLTLKAGKMMHDNVHVGLREGDSTGYAGCLLRNAAVLLSVESKLE